MVTSQSIDLCLLSSTLILWSSLSVAICKLSNDAHGLRPSGISVPRVRASQEHMHNSGVASKLLEDSQSSDTRLP